MDAEKNLEKLVERQRAYFVEGKTLSVDMRLQALERLEKAGLLTRRENPENRREIRVCLTQEARSLESGCTKAYEKMSGINFSGFSPEEKKSFVNGLDRLYSNLSEYSSSHRL